jgi:hypothetical protein
MAATEAEPTAVWEDLVVSILAVNAYLSVIKIKSAPHRWSVPSAHAFSE